MSSCQTGRQFPEGFLWGAATSPTQIEGQTCNEWKGFVARDGNNPDDGCDHWENFERDFLLLKKMNLNSYRFGLDWGRLQPEPMGELDAEAVSRYRDMLQWLQDNQIEPLVTLFHFACPQWLAEKGGWTHRHSPRYFADFVRRLSELGLPVKYWVTINEPGVYVTMSYIIGLFPPKKKFSFWKALKVSRNLVQGHLLARDILRSADHQAQVGIAKHFKYFLPHRHWHFLDKFNSWLCKKIFALRTLDAFCGTPGGERTCDFIGVNYYGRLQVKGFSDVSPVSGFKREFFEANGSSCDDMWEQDAQWMQSLLPSLTRRYGVPLYITETGFATADENLRINLFVDHLKYIHKSLEAGADVRGVYYWTLTDNFEWAEGFTKCFGLAAIDFASTERARELREIAHVYSAIAKTNCLPRCPLVSGVK